MITKTELTEHNIELYITLCKLLHKQYLKHQSSTLIWRYKENNRTTFILGIGTAEGTQIIQEVFINRWDEIDCKEFKRLPKYDGHNSQDVLDRLKKL